MCYVLLHMYIIQKKYIHSLIRVLLMPFALFISDEEKKNLKQDENFFLLSVSLSFFTALCLFFYSTLPAEGKRKKKNNKKFLYLVFTRTKKDIFIIQSRLLGSLITHRFLYILYPTSTTIVSMCCARQLLTSLHFPMR